jgi:hypothetical protein
MCCRVRSISGSLIGAAFSADAASVTPANPPTIATAITIFLFIPLVISSSRPRATACGRMGANFAHDCCVTVIG